LRAIDYSKSFDQARTAETTRYRNRMLELNPEMREIQQMAQLHQTECVTLHRGDPQGTQAWVLPTSYRRQSRQAWPPGSCLALL
jgi:hypothetical protein